MTVLENILISVSTTLVTALCLILVYWFKGFLIEKSLNKEGLKKNKRDSFKNLLDQHSKILLGKQYDENWEQDFSDMCISILLWGSDKVLKEYATYVQNHDKNKVSVHDHEIYFAKTILAFRKELGYKNKRDKISPEQIVLIFRMGFNKEIR